jgi:hypothetical protein
VLRTKLTCVVVLFFIPVTWVDETAVVETSVTDAVASAVLETAVAVVAAIDLVAVAAIGFAVASIDRTRFLAPVSVSQTVHQEKEAF